MEDFAFKFKVFPQDAPLVSQRMAEYYGFVCSVEGGEVFVKKTPKAIRPFSQIFLKRNYEYSLKENPKKISEVLFQTINQEVLLSSKKVSEEFLREKENFLVPAQLGWVSDSEELHLNLAFAFNELRIREIIEKDLIPFVTQKNINAEIVLPISANIELPRFLSLIKMTLIVKENSREKAQEYIEKGAYEGISLDINSPLKLLNSLSRLGGFFFSLPFLKDGAAWHFYTKGVFNFPYLFTQSFTETFLLRTSPRASIEPNFGLKTPKFGEKEIWMFFAQIIDGINTYFSFLFDPKNFLKIDKEVDLVNQLKALGLTELLIADLEGVNYSNAMHSRLSFSLLALDKLANLKKALGGGGGRESEYFEKLISLSQKRVNSKILKKNISFSREKLLNFLLALNEETYCSIHENLGNQFEQEANESQILKRLRNLRNLHHGTFLNTSQFETLFSKKRAFLPEKIVYLPFILMICLLLNPEEFLSNR